MAIQDFTKLLGKRVGYWTGEEFSHLIPKTYITGVLVAYLVYADGYEKHDDEQVLFLQDGELQADFISSFNHFEILEN